MKLSVKNLAVLIGIVLLMVAACKPRMGSQLSSNVDPAIRHQAEMTIIEKGHFEEQQTGGMFQLVAVNLVDLIELLETTTSYANRLAATRRIVNNINAIAFDFAVNGGKKQAPPTFTFGPFKDASAATITAALLLGSQDQLGLGFKLKANDFPGVTNEALCFDYYSCATAIQEWTAIMEANPQLAELGPLLDRIEAAVNRGMGPAVLQKILGFRIQHAKISANFIWLLPVVVDLRRAKVFMLSLRK